MKLRLRMIVLSAAEYGALPQERELMARELARRSGVADLLVYDVRRDGDGGQVFVHSESFEPYGCC